MASDGLTATSPATRATVAGRFYGDGAKLNDRS